MRLFNHFSQGHFPIEICVGWRVDLPQAQSNPVSIGFDLDHPQGNHIPFMQNLFRVCHSLLADLGDVDQSFQILTQACKSTKLGQMCDGALDQLSFL